MPLLIGWFPSQSGDGEIRESQMDAFSNQIPWQLTWVQWFELQNVLAESELPEYRKPSDESYDETDSKIWIVWRTDDGEKAQTLSGSQAEALEALVLVLPGKRMLHPSLKQSSVRCAKQQSWSEFTGSKTPRLRVTASASFSMSGRAAIPSGEADAFLLPVSGWRR